jgi:hypothetical protein
MDMFSQFPPISFDQLPIFVGEEEFYGPDLRWVRKLSIYDVRQALSRFPFGIDVKVREIPF